MCRFDIEKIPTGRLLPDTIVCQDPVYRHRPVVLSCKKQFKKNDHINIALNAMNEFKTVVISKFEPPQKKLLLELSDV